MGIYLPVRLVMDRFFNLGGSLWDLTTNMCEPILGLVFGYIMGGNGSSTITRMSFTTEEFTTVSDTLSATGAYGCGINNIRCGYLSGRREDSGIVYYRNIDKINFNTEDVSLLTSIISKEICTAKGVHDTVKAFMMGGFLNSSGAECHYIEKFLFSTEGASAISELLDQASQGGQSVHGSTKGYLMGGRCWVSRIMDINFSTELSSTVAYLSTNIEFGAGVNNNEIKGYTMGGLVEPSTILDRIECLTFATEARAVIAAKLQGYKYAGTAGLNNIPYGYATGGIPSNVTDRLNFSDETTSVTSHSFANTWADGVQASNL